MATIRFHGLAREWSVQLWEVSPFDGTQQTVQPCGRRNEAPIPWSVSFSVTCGDQLDWVLSFNDGEGQSQQRGGLDMCGAEEVHLAWDSIQNTFVPVPSEVVFPRLPVLQVPTGKRCMQL